ncbi:MAG: transketolase family protein [Clostridiales bacterium]|nr:transketolase family protein [Clostridiales bacterium]
MSNKIATREAYGDALVELGKDHSFFVLDADLAEATKTVKFKKAFPERHIDCGIAEANMISVAAGLAAAGNIAYASTFAMFAAGRAFEQIRNSVAYPKLNVKIGATHGGITVGEDGATHQCLEDLALMRTLPGMTVINPADATEAKKAVEAAYSTDGPVYMRFGRYPVPVLFDEQYSFTVGKGVKMTDGTDVTLIGTGIMVSIALEAAELLKTDGIQAEVINIHTIKPLDRELILASAHKTGAIVTAEEHSVIGGLGSAVTECVCEGHPVPVLRVGIEDQFGQSGSVEELLAAYKLTPAQIAAKAKAAIAQK